MKQKALIGIILIVLGVVALSYNGITYTKREKVVDIGPIQAFADREKTIPISPILGALAVAGGFILLLYKRD